LTLFSFKIAYFKKIVYNRETAGDGFGRLMVGV